MSQPVDNSRVWFITGASRGLGRAFAEAALGAGDRVVGTARDVAALDELVAQHKGCLVAFPLDVTSREQVFAGVDRAVAAFGRLDIVVNNAGQLLLGMLEETTEAQARAHLDVNFFGALWVGQAVVPRLRDQGCGHIFQVTAMGAGGGSTAVGLYCAGKAALNAVSETLAAEVEPFGIKVTILEPGAYETSLGYLGTTATDEHQAYAALRAELNESWSESGDPTPGPEKAAALVVEISHMDQPPKRVVLGGKAYDEVLQDTRERVAEYTKWEALSRRGD